MSQSKIPDHHTINGICTGTIEIWDQTICPECGDELWNYPYLDALGLPNNEIGIALYEIRFMERHPFMLGSQQDPGDEDPHDGEPEVFIGGWMMEYNRYHYGNNLEKWTS